MTETEARTMLEQAMTHARADHTQLVLSGSKEASTRFANNAITQNVSKADTTLSVESAYDNKVGAARINQLNADAIADAVRRAEESARNAAPNTEYMPPIEPCSVPEIAAWDELTAVAAPETRATGIVEAIKVAEQAGTSAAGSFATEAGFTAMLNSRGMFAESAEPEGDRSPPLYRDPRACGHR